MQHLYIRSAPMLRLLDTYISPAAPAPRMHLTLPHLYNIPEYLAYYRACAANGEYLLQDNSIFELKTVVGGDLIDYARCINAKEVMIPEVLRDSYASLELAEQFFEERTADELVEFDYAAAVQGKTYKEVAKHYKLLADNPYIKTIAIPFNLEFDCNDVISEERKQSGWNRFSIINKLIQQDIWSNRKRHHLLGLYNPAELVAYHPAHRLIPYSAFASIRSNDSSSAFWHAMYGTTYALDVGLVYKKIETHVDFQATYTSEHQFNCFSQNAAIIDEYLAGKGGAGLLAEYRMLLNGVQK